MVDGPVPEHLEILGRPLVAGRGIGPGVGQAHPFHGFLGHAVHGERLRQPGRFEHGGRDVDHVVKLRTQAAVIADPGRPRHHQAVAGAAEVARHLLHPLERRRSGPAPANRIVMLVLGAADLVDVRQHRRHIVWKTLLCFHVVQGAGQRTLGTGAIVAHDVDDERVVAQAHGVEGFHDPPHLGIDVLEEAREHFLRPGVQPSLVSRTGIPGGDRIGAWGELGTIGYDPKLLLALEGQFTLAVPTMVERPLVAVGPFGGDVMRGVRRARGDVGEERLVRGRAFLLADPTDAAIGDRFGEMPAWRIRRRLDRRRVLIERCFPLVRLAALEPIPVVESEAGGPAVERASRTDFVIGRVVPFAEGSGAVAILAKRLRDRRPVLLDRAVIAGKPGCQLHDVAGVDRMMVPPGEQRRPCRRAKGSGVEAVVAKAGIGQALGHRRVGWSAKDACLSKAHVVEQDQQHVGSAGGRFDQSWPVRFGIGVGRADPALEWAWRRRQRSTILPIMRHSRLPFSRYATAAVPSEIVVGPVPARKWKSTCAFLPLSMDHGDQRGG